SPEVHSSYVWGRTANKVPGIENTTIVDNRKTGTLRLESDIADKGELDIASYNGLSNVLTFSNATLTASFNSFPYTTAFNVSDWKGAYSATKTIDISENDSGLRADDYQHNLSTQQINRTVTLTNNVSSSINYDLTLTEPGSTTVQGPSWNGTIPGTDAVTHTGVYRGDWITNIQKSTHTIIQTTGAEHSLSSQTFANQTQLSATNTRSFQFTNVNISTYCTVTTQADIPPGDNVVTTACTNTSRSGDFIRETTYPAHPTVNEVTLGVGYVAIRNLHINNTKNVSWTGINTTVLSQPAKCQQSNATKISITANEVRNRTLGYTCQAGTTGSGLQTIVDKGSQDRVWFNISNIEIYSNVTDTTRIIRKIDEDNLKNWNYRDAGSAKAWADQSSRNISIIDGEGYAYIVVGTQHTNSSIHATDGSHTMALTYTYNTESPTGGGGGGGGSGGSSGTGGSTEDDQTSDWDVNFDTRNPYIVPPGSTQNINFKVNNLLAQANTVRLTELTSQYPGCQYIQIQTALSGSQFGDFAVYQLKSKTEGFGDSAFTQGVLARISTPPRAELDSIANNTIRCAYQAKSSKGNAEDLLLTVRLEETWLDKVNDWLDQNLNLELISGWDNACFSFSAIQTDATCQNNNAVAIPQFTGSGIALITAAFLLTAVFLTATLRRGA
ncbi:MAG: hypothetical protein SVU32_09240, partial [Candidatus Nanohaloarchaea archaeon]|nr:hypothetical protein [Candidatus Nanohaloarchaea archaeon]